MVLLSRWNFVVFLYSFRYLKFLYLFLDRPYASLITKITNIIKNVKNKLRIFVFNANYQNMELLVLIIFRNVISYEEEVFGYELIYLNDSIG